MTIFYAVWQSRVGADLHFDQHECSGFDREKIIEEAKEAYDRLSSRQKAEMYLVVYEIPYEKGQEDPDSINQYGYDPDALDWDRADGAIQIGADH